MSECIHLIGADDVAGAGHRIENAGQDMRQASDNFQETIGQFQRFMDDWLINFKNIIEKEDKK